MKKTWRAWQMCVTDVGLLCAVVVVVFEMWWWCSLQHHTTTITPITARFVYHENTIQKQMARVEEKEEEEEAMPVKGYTFPNCDCIRFGVDVAKMESMAAQTGSSDWLLRKFNLKGHSTCSHYSTQRGGGQKVISYSYYNTNSTTNKASLHYKKYMGSLHTRARHIAKVYPDFLIRIYHNVSAQDITGTTFLCRMVCTHAHVDLCNVTQLPRLGNLVKRGVVGRIWRFAVLGDPTVDLFLSRDSDSYVLDREVTAVQEWLGSGRAFHVMRDHPHHRAVILAGLWGGINKRLDKLAKIRNTIFAQPTNLTTKYDQYLLAAHLWPVIKNDTLQHDSYTCQLPTHAGAQPFPSMREGDQYCGCGPYKVRERWLVSRARCPAPCRPVHHQDWTHC